MGKAISSADLDSDHKLRNEKLSKIIETPSVDSTTKESESTDDSGSGKVNTDSKSVKSNEQTSKAPKANTAGGQ